MVRGSPGGTKKIKTFSWLVARGGMEHLHSIWQNIYVQTPLALSQYFPIKDTVVDYWWYMHLDLCSPKMNQQSILSLLPYTQKTIRYYIVWNSHLWMDRYISLLCFYISPFRQRRPSTLKTVRRTSVRSPQLSQYSIDKWTLTCLGHNRLIVPHKVPILTASQTQLPFSPHTKKCWLSSAGKVRKAHLLHLAATYDWRTIKILLQNIPAECTHYLTTNHVSVIIHAE